MAGKNDWIANGKWVITDEERKKILDSKISKKLEFDIFCFREEQVESIRTSINNLIQKHLQYLYSGEIEKIKGVQPGEYGKSYPKEL